MATAQSVAGWYDDPWGQAQSRYWDGVQWTSHVHGAAYPPPVQAASPPQVAQPPSAYQQQPGYQQPSAAPAGYQQQPGYQQPPYYAQPAPSPQPASPQPAAQLPEPQVRSEDVVALSDTQRGLLAKKLTFGGLFGEAWLWALSVPVALGIIGKNLTKIASWIPIFGWIFAIWAIGGTIVLVVGTALASPLLALLLLPIVLLVKRPKFARDLESGAARRQAGIFVVTKSPLAGGRILTGSESVTVGTRALESMRTALAKSEPFSFDGALVFARESHELLGGYDASGRELFLGD